MTQRRNHHAVTTDENFSAVFVSSPFLDGVRYLIARWCDKKPHHTTLMR